MLEIKNLIVKYGKIEALKGISIKIIEGDAVAVIGANGAGKSTTLKAISGLIEIVGGEIEFLGRKISNIRPADIVKLGLVQIPEGRMVFNELTVKDNLLIGAYCRNNPNEINADIEKILVIFPQLAKRIDQRGGKLSGGEQQMLAIGRGLMARPKLLLIDEPSLGLSPLLVNEIFKTISQLNERGTTILFVEQNAHKALKYSNKAYVMQLGRIMMEESSNNLLRNESLIKAYLG